MSRPLRLEFAGALYHITSRGNEKKAINLEDADFELFLSLIKKEIVSLDKPDFLSADDLLTGFRLDIQKKYMGCRI